MNTNLFLGSSWIDTQRFKFERRIDTPADFIRQKTVVNANMWTPKQVSTTQTLFFCSTGDEDRLGGSVLSSNGKPKNNISDQHPFLGKGDSSYAEWEPILWGLGHRGVVPGSDPQDKVYYPSLMHRGVTFNNRLGWTRYSPAGFGKDASGYIMDFQPATDLEIRLMPRRPHRQTNPWDHLYAIERWVAGLRYGHPVHRIRAADAQIRLGDRQLKSRAIISVNDFSSPSSRSKWTYW